VRFLRAVHGRLCSAGLAGGVWLLAVLTMLTALQRLFLAGRALKRQAKVDQPP